MTNYNRVFIKYILDLAEKKPSPGGGSVSCLIFCLGSSLIEKAIKYSIFNKKIIEKHSNTIKKLRERIAPYIDKDGEVFEKILKLKGKKKSLYLKISQNILKDLGNCCKKIFSLAQKVKPAIKNNIKSDFLIGIELIRLALWGTILNLDANEKIFKIKSKIKKKFKIYLKEWQF